MADLCLRINLNEFKEFVRQLDYVTEGKTESDEFQEKFNIRIHKNGKISLVVPVEVIEPGVEYILNLLSIPMKVNANIGLSSCALDISLSEDIQKEIINEYLLSKENGT
ncbi:hypothetical protein [Methanobacterium sp. MBAC-LM]|uniref:hypothetical protein n=1 Tax=Methanobacterium sp. MBAC-LM TaxID=3412034 RepID=UPI003C711AA3